ncbi:SYP3 [Auxenochlorella protothecoides x Auxenochlorella symbiontica]
MASLQGARPLGPTNARDRTSEFMAVVQRLQSSQGPSSSNRQDLTASPTPASHSAFSRHAAAIGLGIHSTSQKLAQLAALARRTSMFDDPAQEIGELSSLVKADIQSLSAGIAELAAMSAGPSAGPSRQAADHSHTVVDSLRSRLKDATKEFKDVLTLRTDSLRVHADRRSLFSAEAEPRFGPPLGAQASFLPTQSRHPLVQRRNAGLENGHHPPGDAPAVPPQAQTQLLAVAPQDTYLDSRAGALRQVESTITELGGIFQQLAHLVAEQGEVALRIDENVDDTLANVDAGQAQLLKYYDTISSNRWLILKVFGVLMLFLAFFVTFIA